jgi:SAM-dependent methyltransferase
VRAVDLSAVGLAKAERLAASRGVQIETQVTDLATLELAEGSYELIVSIWAHVPPPLRRRVHTSVARALAPGGLFVLEAYAPANVGRGVGGPQDASLCMRLADLEAELPGLSTVYGVEKERDVNEGKYHVGLSAVTQLVAQR